MNNKKRCCPRCKQPNNFKILNYSSDRPIKPVFECNKCEDQWSYGYDGGDFLNFVTNKKDIPEIILKYNQINQKG